MISAIFFKQKTAYEIHERLVGSEMCIRDSDNLGGRKILPGTSNISLSKDLAGNALKKSFKKAFEYSDCWIEDNLSLIHI